MGWTGTYNYIWSNNGSIDRKATPDNEFKGWENGNGAITENIKSAMHGTTYYSAMKTTQADGSFEIWALIIITSVNSSRGCKEFMYKEMSEDMLPGYYDCPASILNLLTETDNENANTWRNMCKEAKEAKKNSWLKKLPIGGKILYTTHSGEQRLLVKHPAAYQFKTWFWFCPSTGQYVKKNVINENNSVLYMENIA
jgi:hypothetical protein